MLPGAPLIEIGERVQCGAAVAFEGRPVHQRQLAWRELRQRADLPGHARVHRRVLEHFLRGDRRADDVAAHQPLAVAQLREKIAAQQRAAAFLVQHAGVQQCGTCGVSM